MLGLCIWVHMRMWVRRWSTGLAQIGLALIMSYITESQPVAVVWIMMKLVSQVFQWQITSSSLVSLVLGCGRCLVIVVFS